MEAIVERDNLKEALARVKRNKGPPGIDGMTVEALGAHVKDHWPTSRVLDVLGCRHVGLVHFHEVDALEERLVGMGVRIEVAERAFSTYSSKNGMPTTPLSGVLTYCPLILKCLCAGSPALPFGKFLSSASLITGRGSVARGQKFRLSLNAVMKL
jgi:hypothetical protein